MDSKKEDQEAETTAVKRRANVKGAQPAGEEVAMTEGSEEVK
jgi:hypothetical protein